MSGCLENSPHVWTSPKRTRTQSHSGQARRWAPGHFQACQTALSEEQGAKDVQHVCTCARGACTQVVCACVWEQVLCNACIAIYMDHVHRSMHRACVYTWDMGTSSCDPWGIVYVVLLRHCRCAHAWRCHEGFMHVLTCEVCAHMCQQVNAHVCRHSEVCMCAPMWA